MNSPAAMRAGPLRNGGLAVSCRIDGGRFGAERLVETFGRASACIVCMAGLPSFGGFSFHQKVLPCGGDVSFGFFESFLQGYELRFLRLELMIRVFGFDSCSFELFL